MVVRTCNVLCAGHKVRGPLKIAKDKLLEPKEPNGVLQYMATFKDRLKTACELAHDNLGVSQRKTKVRYDKKAVPCVFSGGEKVLVLMPMDGASLRVKFCGPYSIIEKASDHNYVISTPERRQKTQLCHENLLKPYVERDASDNRVEVEAQANCKDDVVPHVEPITARLKNFIAMVDLGTQLSFLTCPQIEDVIRLVGEHQSLFKDTPGLTHVLIHDVDTGNAPPH